MNRRDALKSISLMLGGALVGSSSFLNGQTNQDADHFAVRFGPRELELLDEIAETILPATEDSAGAKAARLGQFMREIVSNNYNDEERAEFLAGIDRLDRFSRARAGRGFLDATPSERFSVLLELERESSARYYRMMKELTLWGYFSSEVGMTQALNHRPVPGRWDPCIAVAPGSKAWS